MGWALVLVREVGQGFPCQACLWSMGIATQSFDSLSQLGVQSVTHQGFSRSFSYATHLDKNERVLPSVKPSDGTVTPPSRSTSSSLPGRCVMWLRHIDFWHLPPCPLCVAWLLASVFRHSFGSYSPQGHWVGGSRTESQSTQSEKVSLFSSLPPHSLVISSCVPRPVELR